MKKPTLKLDSDRDLKDSINKLPNKQITLFACDCARIVLHIFEKSFPKDRYPRLAIEAAEEFSPGCYLCASRARLSACSSDSINFINTKSCHAAWAAVFASYCCSNKKRILSNACTALKFTWSSCFSKKLINSFYQNSYNDGKIFPNHYKTPDVLNMAQSIIKERDFASSPILADALEDAGCNDDALLFHLRNDTIGLSDWTLFNLRKDISC
jgi:hypothetical protein